MSDKKINKEITLVHHVGSDSEFKTEWEEVGNFLEAKINDNGTIFGKKLKVVTEFVDYDSVAKNFEDYFLIDESVVEKHDPDIFVVGFMVQDQKILDFYRDKDGIFFLSIDPTHKEKLDIPFNCIDIQPSLLRNQELVAWLSVNLNVLNTYIFYHPEITRNPQEYRLFLKKINFSGNSYLIPVPEKIGDDFQDADKNKEVQQKIVEDLFNRKDFKFKDDAIFCFNLWPRTLASTLCKKISEKYSEPYFLSLAGALNISNSLYAAHGLTESQASVEELQNKFQNKSWSQLEIMSTGLAQLDLAVGPLFYSSKLLKIDEKEYTCKKFSSLASEALSALNGKEDFYLGCYPISYIDNTISPKKTSIYQTLEIKHNQRDSDEFVSSLFRIQSDETQGVIEVWYVDIDIIRVTNIDVSEGVWSAEIEIEINSTSENPLELIFFKNLLSNDFIENAKLVRSETDKNNRFQKKYRVVEDFRFEPDINDFPFDNQNIKIEYKIEETLKDNVILQPPVSKTADNEFEVKGWKINEVKAGVKYYKNFDRVGTKMETVARLSQFSEITWNLSRKNSIPAIRSLVPLSVLIFLSWYCSFLPIESANTTIALNTTVFLAGVALYFSADRPNGYSLTLIDKYFIGFYIAHGTVLLSEFSFFISKEFYDFTHLAWQIMLPVIFSIFILFFFYKSRFSKKISK